MLRRLASRALAVVGVCLLVFLLVHLIPGDPVDNLLGERADARDKAALRACLDLDQTLAVQLGRFARHILDGTLGVTCPDGAHTVASRIAAVLPSTVTLALAAMTVALGLALPLGIAAALRPRSWVDRLTTTIALAGLSIPTPWLGPILLSLFYVRLGWAPGPGTLGWRGLVLPAFMLGTHLMAVLARLTRATLLDVLGEEYIRTAAAKGLSPSRIVVRHALPNALLPILTVAGLQLGSLLSGAVVTELVFARPGLGTLLLEGIVQRDYRVVQGCTLVIALFYVAVNVAVDALYAAVDPRVRHRVSAP